MRHTKIIIAGIGFAAVAAAGGITAASAGASPANAPSARHSAAATTVRTARAAVGGKTETILVDGRGLPLYFYRPDTATKSLVTGSLARLWPPLTSASPAAGVNGKLAVVSDAHGDQVAYNGHLLYTFADDHAGQVTGQRFQDFFVATPGVAPIARSSAPAGTAPTGTVPSVPPGGGYGY
jgi:predicted lipoprotein with Yx(FWY)xxD motif